MSNPFEFIKRIDNLLDLNGVILFCCPTQSAIALETIFIDHLFHYSEKSFEHLVDQSGLILTDEFVAPWDANTHCYVVKKHGISCRVMNRLPPLEALEHRRQLIQNLKNLDSNLSCSTKDRLMPVYLFGAGETSQIIECFAPRFFRAIKGLIASSRVGARGFDKEIHLLNELLPNSCIVVLGVRKEIQESVMDLLIDFGWDKANIIRILL